jgi:hypothetical protein
MDTLLTLYFVTLSLELVLSLVMLTLLLLILAPRGSTEGQETFPSDHAAHRLAQTPEAAVRSAFQVVSRGRDEPAVLVHARFMLAQLCDQER